MRALVLRSLCVCLLAAAPAFAQQQPPPFGSPEVSADRTVTFRFWAPHAKEVRVTSMEGQKSVAMQKDDRGIWTATVGPLDPDLYSYAYEVDGATVTDPRNPDVKAWLTSNSMVLVPGTPPRLHEVQDVPHGTVVMHTYRSAALGQTRQMYVYTPPGYTDRSKPLPVVYLKHGFGDGPSAWTAVGQAHVIADNLIAQKKMVPMLIVMPWGHVKSPRFARDRAELAGNDEGVEKELLQDIIPFVESRYRAARSPDKRAIVGLSMGGGQSLRTGLGHPDLFRWIGAFSSGTPEGDLDALFPRLKDVAAKHLRLLWIGIGKDDFLLQRNERFHAWLQQKGITHEWTLSDGGHEWPVWRTYLGTFLPLIFK
jgi:enterochelin esterase family protein